MPVVDLASEMTDMILATRSYQANLRVLQAARERYEAAMQIGRRS
jgi:flagellar basal-body rod protein FlgC